MKGIWVISASSIVYALVRYVLLMPKYLDHIPSFILNKAVGMAASFFLVYACWCKCRNEVEKVGIYFRATMFSVVMHVPLSLNLLRPGYFPEFFAKDGTMLKFWGEAVVLCGAISLALLWQSSREKLSILGQQKLGLGLLAALFCHVGSMGICRGIVIDVKHAFLPPMWLLSLIAIAIGFFVLRKANFKSR